MDKDQETTSLEQLLDRIDRAAAGRDQLSLGAIVDAVGPRSFGPLLLVSGLITLAPVIGDIPGVPTIIGLLVLLTAGQLLFHRRSLWLPRWLRRRSASSGKARKALEWMRRPARFLDRWSRPRLLMFTRGVGLHVVVTACIVIAAAMPLLDFVPFSANGAGAALTAFGLSLIARDGLLALLALVVAVGTFGVVVYSVL